MKVEKRNRNYSRNKTPKFAESSSGSPIIKKIEVQTNSIRKSAQQKSENSEKVGVEVSATVNSAESLVHTIEVGISPNSAKQSDSGPKETTKETEAEANELPLVRIFENADAEIDFPQIVEVKTKKKNWGQYEKKYKLNWECDPKFSGWLCPHPSNAEKAVCKYCSCILRAHKTDLYKHYVTGKHKKNADKFGDDDKSKKMYIPIKSSGQNLKDEKLLNPDESFIILESDHGGLSPERDTTSIFMDCSDMEPREETVESEHRNNPVHAISGIAARIGCILTQDVEKILRTNQNVLNFFKNNRENADSSMHKMTRICVGHLSQKYLVESALESAPKNPSMSKDKGQLASRFRAIEQNLQTTMTEMKNLKCSFETFSDVLPFAAIDLSGFLPQSSNQHS